MKKRVVAIFVVAYVIIGFSGFLKYMPYAYIEQDSWDAVMRSHLFLLIVSALLMSAVLLLCYKNLFPITFQKRKNKIGFKIIAPILAFSLGFAFNLGLMHVSDSFLPKQQDKIISGIVIYKTANRNRYGTRSSMAYAIAVYNNETKQESRITVKKRGYENTREGEKFHKKFEMSYWGVVYQKEN